MNEFKTLMTQSGVELYLYFANLSLLRDSLSDQCHALYDAYLEDRARSIYRRIQCRTDSFRSIISEELTRGSIDAAATETIMRLVTRMLRDEDDCDNAQWSDTEYDNAYAALRVADDAHAALSSKLIRLYMVRGVWKTFLNVDVELVEAFVSSAQGLVALGLDDSINLDKLDRAYASLRCRDNSSICRHCSKRIKNAKYRCRLCKRIWFCNMQCSIASTLDLELGHVHECELIKTHAV
jgi:hypothetical protein